MKDICPECRGRGEEEYDYPREDELDGEWETVWETCHTCLGKGEIDMPPDTVLARWCNKNKMPHLDVFDLFSRKDLTPEQKSWLTDFIVEMEKEHAC